jgi:hypothetical protein
MFRAIRKAILAQKLHDRGICPKHGETLFYDRSETKTDAFGIVRGVFRCQSCSEEAELRRQELAEAREREIEEMLEEYRSL